MSNDVLEGDVKGQIHRAWVFSISLVVTLVEQMDRAL